LVTGVQTCALPIYILNTNIPADFKIYECGEIFKFIQVKLAKKAVNFLF